MPGLSKVVARMLLLLLFSYDAGGQADAQKIVNAAHEICPSVFLRCDSHNLKRLTAQCRYSNATRNNIDVIITVK